MSTMPDSDSIFLTPRVIDQKGIEQLVASLRDLVDSARAESRQLREAMDEASGCAAEAADLSRQMHERLNLGARMLKAFQSQIDRVDALLVTASQREESLAALGNSISQQAAAFESRIEQYLTKFDTRLKDASRRAAERFEKEIGRHDDSVSKISSEISEAAGKLNTVEERIAALDRAEEQHQRRREQIQQATDHMTRDAHAAACTINEARAALEHDLGRAGEELSTFETSSRSIQKRMTDLLASCAQQLDSLESREASARALATELETGISTRINEARRDISGCLQDEVARTAAMLRSMAARAEDLLAATPTGVDDSEPDADEPPLITITEHASRTTPLEKAEPE
ncbi:MAG: hypothetical protein ACR2GY_05340 [Phycisphaerales bacterium]